MTTVEQVRGIGEKTAQALATRGIHTAEDLSQAAPDHVAGMPGFGTARATRVIEAARALAEVQGSDASARTPEPWDHSAQPTAAAREEGAEAPSPQTARAKDKKGKKGKKAKPVKGKDKEKGGKKKGKGKGKRK